ncbi:MAG: TonB-dependent receptor [Gammaproteobacteria bacterium]|jgi:outer membrane receptor protein involved in Fe transport
MRRAIAKLSAATVLICCALSIQAADELAVYVFKDGNAATGLKVRLDGLEEKTVADDGSVFFDLTVGGHIIVVLDKGNTVFSQRLDTAQGQYADLSVSLRFGEEPQASLETYFQTEAPSERALAPRGSLLGRVTSNGLPIADAVVKVNGVSTRTDADGNYRVELPRGLYTVTIEDSVLGAQKIEGVRVVTNIERGASFAIKAPSGDDTKLAIEAPQIEEIFAIAKYKPEALGESERYSAGVVDTLGIGELSRFGGTDIARSVIRVPSVTVKDGRFVFIRGLGGRYITTTLNGATLPSTDPAKRTIPLDLFPSNFVSQLDVKKNFIAPMPGESTGGNLVINTRTYPAEAEGRITVSTGFTQGLTGEDVFSDPTRGDFDWAGADDGSRSKAATYRAISDALRYSDFYPEVAVQGLGAAGASLLKNDLDITTTEAKPKGVIGASYGNVFDLDWQDAEFGFFAAGNYRNDWEQRVDGIERTYRGSSDQGTQEINDNFVFDEYSNQIDASGLLNLGLTFNNSTFGANTLASRSTQSRVKYNSGLDGDALQPSERYIIDWVERQFISQQFTGNHITGEKENLIADWQITVSRAERDAPDRREVRFDLEGNDGTYNLQVPDVIRRYDELIDDNLDATVGLEYLFDSDGDIESTLSFGVQVIARERDADSETYGFTGGQGVIGIDEAPNLKVSDVLNESTITGNTATGFTFQDKTLASDSYEADLEYNSAYLSYDTIIAATYQIVAGARYETYKQTTDTFSLQGSDIGEASDPVRSKIDESEVLPALGFNWFLTDSQTLRFAASQTVSRPDFKESSNATFYDPDFDIRVRGNPDLKISDATNVDVRYQFFWDDVDNFSVGVFYKDFDDPIERVVQPASGTAGNTRTFENADSATLYGIELEARKEWAFGTSMAQSFFVSGNLSWIDSEVDLPNGETRALQGQPEYIANLILGFDDIERNQELTLLLNQVGDTIVDVGVSQQPDIILEPRLDLTMNYRWYFADNWQFLFKGENLLDSEVEFTQGGNVFQQYKTGRQYTFGLNWNF